MTAFVFFGIACALCLGVADFMGRFSARAIDHHNALLGMLLAGFSVLTVWVIWSSGLTLPATSSVVWIIVNGIATTIMTLFLYLGLARGPVSVVAPIVASHPILIVLYYAIFHGGNLTLVQMVAGSVVILGTLLVACNADQGGGDSEQTGKTPSIFVTIQISLIACLAYAVLIIAGQAASEVNGELRTLWMGRLVSILFLVFLFVVRRRTPDVPVRWWPFLCVQGLLDAGGYISLFAGSLGSGKEIISVIGATFGAVTVALARIILKEAVSTIQWTGIFLIFVGVAVLA